MIWLTWRQSRLELLLGGGALALIAVFLLSTGYQMHASYQDAGLPSCVAQSATDEGCLRAAEDFIRRYRNLNSWTQWLNLLPFLIGLLLAAPTVLDLEQGTYRLAWTQSVTRRRWMATRIGFGVALAAAAATALIALWTWWRGPLDAIEGRFNTLSFDFEGTAPIAYVVFAFALCLALGALLRRTIPAVGVALVIFLVARIGGQTYVRPHYLEPITQTWDASSAPPVVVQGLFLGIGNGAWILTAELRQGAEGTLVYHPADRFWIFQTIETAIFLGMAAALLGFTFWWVTRRMA